jgi:hypothetical protein
MDLKFFMDSSVRLSDVVNESDASAWRTDARNRQVKFGHAQISASYFL